MYVHATPVVDTRLVCLAVTTDMFHISGQISDLRHKERSL